MTLIVGIDCATSPAKTGLTLGTFEDEVLSVQKVVQAGREEPCQIAERWLAGASDAVIALDAPLGWPLPLAEGLAGHRAGQPLEGKPTQLFSRMTDQIIEQDLKKRPLEVGANLIARTAHAALLLLACLRKALRKEIPLAWQPGSAQDIVAIEVYPAASRLAHHWQKGKGAIEGLPAWVRLPEGVHDQPVDARDSVLCAVAAADFLAERAEAPSPKQLVVAKREGWIWVAKKEPLGQS